MPPTRAWCSWTKSAAAPAHSTGSRSPGPVPPSSPQKSGPSRCLPRITSHRPEPGAHGRSRPRHQHIRRALARLGLCRLHRHKNPGLHAVCHALLRTDQSLVLMDEVGRGTSTFDGLSLAWACAAFIATKIRAFTLFATHYFELTSLASEAPGVVNVHVEAVEHGERLVFLHSVKEGPANQSYGLQVAALAGIPKAVTEEARRYLTELEREREALRNHNSPQGELPFFASTPAPAPESAALAVLRAVDPDTLSPRDALEL